LDRKLNNQSNRMWSNKLGLMANPYKTTGKGFKPNGQEMKEDENGGLTEVARALANQEAEAEKGERGRGTMEVTMEEEETVSPLSSKQSIEEGSKRRQQEGWRLVGGKEKERSMVEATSKANTVGIKMVRIGKTGSTGYSVKDVSYFFKMLERIDPTAMVINARNEKASTMKIKDVIKMSVMD
jgi:hypothetical protein